jgi:hypothetical protein
MKKILFLFIFTSLFISCNEENRKSDFIGNWASISDENFDLDMNFEFYKDSMVIVNPIIYGTFSYKWKVKGDKIEATLLRGNKLLLKNKNINYYKFNSTKDTLFIKNERDSILYIKFQKINNGFEYFENEIGLKIELDKVSDNLLSAGNNDFNFKIYISTKNNKIIAKTDYSNNLNKLTSESLNFKMQIPEKDKSKLKYILFIDKNVSSKKVDSIKSLFIKEIVEKIFIVKNYKENKWNEPIEWLGIYEN